MGGHTTIVVCEMSDSTMLPKRYLRYKPVERKNLTMAKKQTPLRIIPLGGLDGIGKNMTAFEYGNDMVLVDAGLMFPDDEQPGIDLVLPDYSYVLENEDKLRGIIITHGSDTLSWTKTSLKKKRAFCSSKRK